MERIQSAIAKARAERATRGPAPAPAAAAPEPAPAAAAAAAADAVAARWAALVPFVPDSAHLESRRVVTRTGGRAAVPFDVMRTRALQQMRANGWTRIAVTSPTEGCGKSTIAANLAFSLARQAELRTILCELDLRRPALAGILGLDAPLEFSQVLQGTAPFADHARRVGDNLAFALNRSPMRQAAELLTGPATVAALKAVQADYGPQVMLFDLPPMLVSDDALAFAGQVDAVLLVAAAEVTTIRQIDACEQELAAQTNVMGVILNKCRYSGPDYGEAYY
jgi:Mrp family chromosome partitioning ATPase